MSRLEDKMDGRVLFLRCAFPCTESKVHRKEITREDFDYLEGAAKNGTVVEHEVLSRVYAFAVAEMGGIAEELGRPLWDKSVVEEYFFVRHNQIIDSGKGPYENAQPFQKDFCKFYDAEVVDVGNGFLRVKHNDVTKRVLGDFVSGAKVGDRVKIHRGYAVAFVNEKE